jgi:lipid-A-disaccharide synthase
MSNRSLHIAMVAGETSGDMLAALVLRGFKQRWPDLQAFGIGGPQMAAQGFTAWWPSDKLAVRGYIEVLRHYREIVQIRKQLKARLLADPPDVFIGVDAPDFNLDLEADLKAAGIKTVHFISPSIWAWRGERIEKIKRAVDHMLCVFPFEAEIYEKQSIAATYVGHPLANVIAVQPDRAAARAVLGLPDDTQVLAVLPGSRASEVKYMALAFFRAVALVKSARVAIKFIVPAVSGLKKQIEQAAMQAGVAADVQIVQGQSHLVLAACDATLIASGTATLEAALFKRPMVIAYRMNYFTWLLMRNKAYLPWIGLPNILCRNFVVPELVQGHATPQALAEAALVWLSAARETPEKIQALEQRFTQLHHDLQRDTAQLATHALEKVLNTQSAR